MSIEISDVILKKVIKKNTNIDPCDIVSVNQSPMNQILEIFMSHVEYDIEYVVMKGYDILS